MEFKAKDIATLLHGVVEGDPEIGVNDVAKIEEGRAGTLAFLANPKYEPYIYSTRASIVLVDKTFVPAKPLSCTLIRVASAYEAFATLLQLYDSLQPRPTGIEQPSYIGEGVTLGKELYIGAFAYIGKGAKVGDHVQIYPHVYIGEGVEIGEHTVIYSGVHIYARCRVGASCILHSGAVIGADGFGFVPDGEGYKKIPQIGNVIIEDRVEIGANTCVDRATMGSTMIREGVKLDNLIQVAHNAVVGRNTVMAAQSGVAGSAKLGERCVIGGQAGVVGHLTLADGTHLTAQSGLSVNTKANAIMRGSPAFDVAKYQRCYVLFRRLPELYEQIKELDRRVKSLNQHSSKE
ncbi:MAG: UDP-3-O-(3-hydroxymyristoyl)glucosamine N-acyltransferase [Odoribacteraceae bacterium]|jgi:UDP-3-O-[3-hydroxymyristoyl] glucosamine N-acyltransferase|nr:UDP-3-O-(3-hydroxymyristoyl)glucosamine N-acyltransferase [Odoribacteraceae bacterium]